MTVYHLGVDLEPRSGGTFRSVGNFSRAVTNLGYQAKIVSFTSNRSSVQTEGIAQVATSRGPLAGRYRWWAGCYTGAIGNLLKDADAIFLHGLFIHPLVHAALWALRHSVPYIVVPHGSLDPYVFTYRAWRKRAWMALYRDLMLASPAGVIFATQAERAKAYGAPEESQARVINWPVPMVADYSKARAAELIRTRHHLAPGSRIALFCGRMHPLKRPLETIRAFQQVAGQDWVLLLVGPPTSELGESELKQICARGGGRCLFVGPVYGQELFDYYRAAELLLLLSQKENFGYTAAEALACGVPAVVSGGVDLSHQIREVRCGFVVQDCTADGLMAALEEVLAMPPDELEAFGRRGRAWARSELSEQKFCQGLSVLLEAVVDPARERS